MQWILLSRSSLHRFSLSSSTYSPQAETSCYTAMSESFSSATGVPTLTQTVTECWVYSVSDSITYSTPAVPQATGAHCFKIYPTGGGTYMTPIPVSEAIPSPTTTLPASTSTSSSSEPEDTTSHSMVGAIVGSVVGILVFAALLVWFMMSRERRRRRREEKHQWAMTSGKWVSEESERTPAPKPISHSPTDENGAGPSA